MVKYYLLEVKRDKQMKEKETQMDDIKKTVTGPKKDRQNYDRKNNKIRINNELVNELMSVSNEGRKQSVEAAIKSYIKQIKTGF